MEMMKVGVVTDSRGREFTWTREHFDRFAASYSFDDDARASPVVLGHPKDNAPRLGYISKVWRDEDTLCCSAEVMEELYNAMEQGLYPNRSISVGINDPVIYHLGILGACMPAFADLAPVAFSAPDPETVAEFTSSQTAWRLNNIGDMLGNMREWIIAKFSLDDADKAIPGYVVDMLKRVNEDENDDNPSLGYGSNKRGSTIDIQKGSPMTEEEIAALKAENEKLKSDNAAFSKNVADMRDAAIAKEAADFAAALVTEKKLFPFQVELTKRMYSAAAKEADNLPAEFSVGGAKEANNPLLELQKQYKSLPILPDFAIPITGDKGKPSEYSASEADKVRKISEYVETQRRDFGRYVSVTEEDSILFLG